MPIIKIFDGGWDMLKRFIAYYRPHRLMFALDMLASLLIAALAMAYPIITREMLNVYIPSGNIDMIGFMAFLLLMLYILRMLLKYFVQYYGHVIGCKMQAQMRHDMFAKLEKLPFVFFDNHETGKIMSRMISDVATQMTAEAYRQLSYYFSGIPLMADKILVRHQSRLKSFAAMIPTYAAGRVASAEKDAAFLWQRIKALAEQKMEAERVRVDGLWKQIDLLSPERVLKRGYSLTLKNGKAVADAAELAAGDEIVTHFASGKSISIVK